MIRLEYRHRIGWCGCFKSDGEKNNLALWIVYGKLQGVEQKGRLLSAVPLKEDSSTIDAGFADAKAFEIMTIDVEGSAIVSREVVANPVSPTAAGRGVRVAVFLARRGLELLYLGAPLDDDDVTGTLEAYGIELYAGAAGNLAEAEKLLIQRAGELYKALPEPDEEKEGAA